MVRSFGESQGRVLFYDTVEVKDIICVLLQSRNVAKGLLSSMTVALTLVCLA